MNDWIKDLKVGDKVIVSSLYRKSVGTVEKITPAGNIKVNGILFNSNGWERGGGAWDRSYLSKATPENIEIIKQESTIAKAKKLMRETTNITFEQAKSIVAMFDKPKIKGA